MVIEFDSLMPQNGEIQLSNDSDRTLCRVAGCITSVRLTYSCADALTYLLTYTIFLGSITPAISPKGLKIERKLLLTAYIKLYTGFDCRQNV